jgi:hypothetical protein
VEIQRLQEECKKMTQEVDRSLDAKVPLGETDEEFYKNIYTGQQGFILPPSSQPPPPSEFCKRWRILILVFCNLLCCITVLSVSAPHRVSQEECARLREGVPYGKVYRYNPKHLCPKLNGYGDNGQRSLKL